MILTIFGWLLIGSAFIVYGWANEVWRHRVPVNPYNAPLILALALDLTAVGFALMLGPRIGQILFYGIDLAIASPLYFVGVSMLLCGKTALVWLAALGEGREYSKIYWRSYWLCIAAWAAFCIVWFW